MKLSRREIIKAGLLGGCGLTLLSKLPRKKLVNFSESLYYKAPNIMAKTISAPNYLDVITLIGLPEDQQLMFVSLQGIVNKKQPRIYVLQDDQEGRLTWLNDLNIAHRFWSSPWEMLPFYIQYVKGAVIWDPKVPDSINVATNLASLHDFVIISPELINAVSQMGKINNFLDLRNQFFSSDQLYQWASETIWPYCNSSFLFGVSPLEPAGAPPVIQQEFFGQLFPQFPQSELPSADTPNGFLRDFAIVTNGICFSFNPTSFYQQRLFNTLTKKVRGSGAYLGWFPLGALGGEDSGVQLLSQQAIAVFASDFFSNMSVFWAVNATLNPQQQVSYTGSYQNKIYVTFTFTDGDNLQYDQHRMRQIWDDPNRGLYPTNWTISPSLAIFSPFMMAYYLNTKTPNDLLIAGPSGNGYCYPNLWPFELLPNYLTGSVELMNLSGLSIVNILNRINGVSQPLSPQVGSLYDSVIAPQGVFLNWDGTQSQYILGKSTPAIDGALVSSVSGALNYLGALEKFFYNGSKPVFASIGLSAFEMTPSDLVTIVKNLNPDVFVTVRGDLFFYYLRQYLNI
jgi:hypothetical protein